jgi:hypothetical protein
MSQSDTPPFSWSWAFASVLIFTAMEIAIAVFLAPAIFAGRLASPMLQMRLQMLLHLASFWVGGVAVGIISPRIRLMEPAVGAFIAVMITFMMSFFMPTHWMSFDLTKLAVGGGIAFALALAGAYSGEKIMGNVENDDDARARVRDRMWGEHGLLSHGDSRLVVPKPSQRARR